MPHVSRTREYPATEPRPWDEASVRSPAAVGLTRALPYAALALLTVIVYGRTIDFPFFYDDLFLTRPIATWRFGAIAAVGGYWRPLWTLWMCTEYQLFGVHPAPMHAVNLALHTINAWLVLSILSRYIGRPWAAATAALWTLIAANATPITWICACDDLVAMMLVLLATRLWLSAPVGTAPSLPRSLLASALWLGAMLNKEVTFAWPLATLAYSFPRPDRGADRDGRASRGLPSLVCPFLALAVYLFLRSRFAGRAAGFSVDRASSLHGASLPVIVAGRALHYTESLLYNFLPLDLFRSWPGLVTGSILTVALVGTLIATARRAPRAGAMTIALGLAWMAAFSLHGAFNPLPRNLYVPTLGAGVALVAALRVAAGSRAGRMAGLLMVGYVAMHAYLGQAAAEDLSASSLATRIHEAQLLTGNDIRMTATTVTPAKRAYLEQQLQYQDRAALAAQSVPETLWRTRLQLEFGHRFGAVRPGSK